MRTWAVAMGDVLSFKLVGRRNLVHIPKDFGILRIIFSATIPPHVLYIGPHLDELGGAAIPPQKVIDWADTYLGKATELVSTKLVVPYGEWERLGVVETVLYDRPGTGRDWWTGELLAGPKYHPFKASNPPVELHRLVCGERWRLVLPEGCKITWHGFEEP